MTTAGEAGLRRVLAVADLLIDAVDEDTLVAALLPLLLRAMPGDSVVWSPHPASDGASLLCLPGDLLSQDMMAAFDRGAAADPLVTHTTTGPGTPARRSALQTPAEYRALAVYDEVYRPIGADHQLAMAFPAGYVGGVPRRVCLAVNRSGSDFTDTDLATAVLLRARLGRALARLAPPPPAQDRVTHREAAVLALLADGLTNQQIAHRLNISSRTVDKHLEHAYPKLRVSGRVEAANAWLTRETQPRGYARTGHGPAGDW